MIYKPAIIKKLTSNGYGYTAGGRYDSNNMDTTERYDDITNIWAPKANLHFSRNFLAGFSLNGYGYTTGGASTNPQMATTEKYDNVADAWIQMYNLNIPRFGLAGFSLNGYGYSSGGRYGSSYSWDTEKYDDVANTWTQVHRINTARYRLSGFSLNGYGYISGGEEYTTYSPTTEKYDDIANIWIVKANLNTARNRLAGFSLNRYGYAIGGYSGITSSIIEIYDDFANNWTQKRHMITGRYGHTGFSLNGYGYTSGGNLGIATAEKYDDVVNIWTAIADMNTARYALAGFSIESAATGNLNVSSTPSGTRIYIDNIDQGIDTPNTISGLTSGNHDVKLSLVNYNDYTTTVSIVSNSTIAITPILTLSPGMTKVQASPSFTQPSFSEDMIDIGTLKFNWNGTGTIILEKTIVYDRLVLTGPNGTFDHTWTPCEAIIPEGPFNITNIFSQGYNEINVKIYNVCGGDIGTETGSIDITGPITLICPTTLKYSGDTITLEATPTGGIGPYYVEFNKDGDQDPEISGGTNPIYNVPENTTITRTYTLTDENVRNALTGTMTFSVFISDSCPTTAQTCTQECIVNLGCIPPVCNFTVV